MSAIADCPLIALTGKMVGSIGLWGHGAGNIKEKWQNR